MQMTGVYQIALLTQVTERAFVDHMTTSVFADATVLQATRITTGFTHQLLRRKGNLRQYAWQVTVDLVTDAGYDFDQNTERVQERIRDFGIVIGVDTYTNVTPGER
jgi:hypothetical protein